MERNAVYRGQLKKIYSQFPPRHEFHNGHVISFLSYDRPENLLGSGLALACPDEMSVMPERVYYNVLLPMLARDGQLLGASNYNQGKNWFWKLAQRGLTEEGHKDGIQTWDLPSSVGPLFQGERGAERLAWYKRNLPTEVWESEFLNKPTLNQNIVFRWTTEKNEQGKPQNGPQPGHRYCMGLDIGRVVDPSYVVIMDCPPVMDVNKPPQGQVVYCEQFQRGVSHAEQAAHAGQLARAWKAVVIADSTGGKGGAAPARTEPFFHLYQREIPGIREYNWNQFSKFRIVNMLALEIEQGRICVPPPETYHMFDPLVNQVKIYTYTDTDNFVRYGAPNGEHDDGVAALAMAAWGKVSGWATIQENPNLQPFVR